MVTYVAQRLIAIVFILFVMSLLIFGITQVMPGNVAHMIAGQFATPDVVAAIEAKLGLRDPIYVQYWRWASGVLHGDLGQSLIMERPVGPMIQEAMARSAILAGLAFVLRRRARHRARRHRRGSQGHRDGQCHLRLHLSRHLGAGVLLGHRADPGVCPLSELASVRRHRAIRHSACQSIHGT